MALSIATPSWKPSLRKLTSLSLICLSLSACQTVKPTPVPAPQVVTISEAEKQEAEQSARLLFAQYAQQDLDSSPMMQAYRGLKTQYDQWDNLSDEFAIEQQRKSNSLLTQAKGINASALSNDLRLSLALLIYELEQSAALFPYRHYNFPVNSLFGLHTEIPNFLVNIHQIHTIQDAKDYITRIERLPELMDQLIEQLKQREKLGIVPPKFVFETVITSCNELLKGYPVERSSDEQHILWSNFSGKVAELQLYSSSEAVLEKRLKRALQRNFHPAYTKLVRYLEQSQAKASQDTGFHQFDQGKDYYALRLNQITTLDTSAQNIHQIGLDQVKNIQQQIFDLIPTLDPNFFAQANISSEQLQTEEGKKAALLTFFEQTRNNPAYYYDDGKTALNDSKRYIESINKVLTRAFADIPNLPMQVKPVEEFRADNAPVAFYQPPSDDGARPATYYMNFEKLSEMPKFQFEALAYHETIPGHHLQTIYALTANELPEFRRHAHFTAYSEGWALYAEGLAKELNGYQDPWNEYGRLLMALWRASRLVLDTGLHHFGWTIEEALSFRLDNTPFSEEDSLDAIQRYIVMPGQATAYMMGQMKLIALRNKAQTALGKRFNLGDYHKFMLRLGPLPLALLEQQIDEYINSH